MVKVWCLFGDFPKALQFIIIALDFASTTIMIVILRHFRESFFMAGSFLYRQILTYCEKFIVEARRFQSYRISLLIIFLLLRENPTAANQRNNLKLANTNKLEWPPLTKFFNRMTLNYLKLNSIALDFQKTTKLNRINDL